MEEHLEDVWTSAIVPRLQMSCHMKTLVAARIRDPSSLMRFYIPSRPRGWDADTPQVATTLQELRQWCHHRLSQCRRPSFKPSFHHKFYQANLGERALRSIAKDMRTSSTYRVVECDKGMGICWMDEGQYEEQVQGHLSNRTNYAIPQEQVDQIRSDMQTYYRCNSRYLRGFPKIIQRFLYAASRPDSPYVKVPRFRLLAKVHKSPHKSRPLASAPKWVTQPHAQAFSWVLENRYFNSVRHKILKNTQALCEVLHDLRHDLPGSYLLASLDVEALYPSVDIRVLMNLLHEHLPRSSLNLLNGVDLTLTSMVVEYGGKFYLQKQGLPMGSSDSVSLANFYLYHLLDNHPLITRNPFIKLYRRFVDDVFIIWTRTKEQWKLFVSILNKHIGHGLFFTVECHEDELKFLDLIVKKTPGDVIQWQPADKPLAVYTYIPPLSMHPPAVFKGFITGELGRLALASSTEAAYQEASQRFYDRLLKRVTRRSSWINCSLPTFGRPRACGQT